MPQPIIKRNRVKLSSPDSPTGSSEVRLLKKPDSVAPPGEKAVRLLEEDGRVTAIELTCSCGEVTVVELLYQDDSTDASEDRA